MNTIPVVFLAFANEQHRYLAQLAEEARALRQLWTALHDQGRCELVWLTNATLDEILETFRKYRNRIILFHFGGHADSYRLLFAEVDGRHTQVDATAFANFLAQQEGLRVVFLNACSTRAQVTALHEAGVPTVIATGQEIRDEVAVDFARAFYQSFISGASINGSFKEAAAAVGARRNDDGTPRHLRSTPDQPATAEPPWSLYSRPPSATTWTFVQMAIYARIANKPLAPESCFIPGGAFLMGEGAQQHSVTLPAYAIGKYPVTNAEYALYVRQTGVAIPAVAGWQLATVGQEPPADRGRHPMVGVSWDEAVAYCAWLSAQCDCVYRLPTEAEWEKAASWVADEETGGHKVIYPWGDHFAARFCNAQETTINQTTAVGAYSPAGDSPYGCADMAGNVWEWTSTQWGRNRATPDYVYPYNPDDGREQLAATLPYREYRICRGGSFREAADRLTTTARARYAANDRTARQRGFRILLDLESTYAKTSR